MGVAALVLVLLAVYAGTLFVTKEVEPLEKMEPKHTPSEFAQKFRDAARRVSLGPFPVSVLLAVSMLETGNGTGGVFRKTRNLFSITKGSWWPVGKPTYKSPNGLEFRVYQSWEESIADFLELMRRSYYRSAYALAVAGDWRGYFHELKKLGYDASSPTYATDLVRTWERLV